MTNEDFYESAVRHWIGGCILIENEEYDNAVCFYGFAAECALKAMMERINENSDVKKYGYFGGPLFQDMKMMLSADLASTVMMDPVWGLRLSDLSIPDILFKDHPKRRYFEDGIYTRADAEICQEAAKNLLSEMVSMRLDGYL